jgi:H+/Cl- antiporter ClcA
MELKVDRRVLRQLLGAIFAAVVSAAFVAGFDANRGNPGYVLASIGIFIVGLLGLYAPTALGSTLATLLVRSLRHGVQALSRGPLGFR